MWPGALNSHLLAHTGALQLSEQDFGRGLAMERIYHKTRSFKDAEEWDILQNVKMTPAERQAVASEIKKRVYGKEAPDVREAHPRK